MKRITWPVTLGTLSGLLLAGWTIGLVGLRQLAHVVAKAGIGGFTLFLVSYLAVLLVLGAAWATSTEGRSRPLTVFIAARAVREAAADLLPFSQIGGLIFGLQILIDTGIAPAKAYASAIVDLTTEMVAQLLLVLMGIAVFLCIIDGTRSGASLAEMTWAGLFVMIALTAAFVMLQRPALRLVSQAASRLVPPARETIDAVRAELDAFARKPQASVRPALCNLAACLLSVFSAWIGFSVLGVHVPIGKVLALEAVIYTLRSGAFLVPGALGVQEAGYALLAPILGIDQNAAMGLALFKRARDISVGLPTLCLWRLAARKS